MKRISFFLCAVFMTMIGFAQGVETFDNLALSGNSYTNAEFVGDDGLNFNYWQVKNETNYSPTGDNISWTAYGVADTCEAPTNVEANQLVISEGQAEVPINWNAGGTETQWEVEYENTNDATDTDVITVNGSPGVILELELGTGYNVQVRAICDETNSDWVGTATVFTTPFPCENPEVTAAVVDMNGEPLDCVEPWSSFNVEFTITGGLGNDSYTVLDENDDIVLTDVVVGTSTVYVSGFETDTTLNYTIVGNNTDECGAEVGVEVEICAADPCDLEAGGGLYGGATTVCNDTDDSIADLLPDAQNGEHHAYVVIDEDNLIAGFEQDSEDVTYDFTGYDEGVYEVIMLIWNGEIQGLIEGNNADDIDGDCFAWNPVTMEVTVETCESEDCAEATGISFGLIDYSSAEVSWTPGDVSQDKWEVVYGPAPFNPLTDTDGESVTVEDDPNVTLTDLTPGTTYQIYVRPICDDGDTTGGFYPNPGADYPEDPPTTPEYFIDLVKSEDAIQNVNNPTGNDGYTDYTTDETKVVTIFENQPVNVTISVQSSGEPVNFGGWIDLNDDGVFGNAPMGIDNTPASGFEQIVTVGGLVDDEVGLLIPGAGLVGGNEYHVRVQVKKSALSPNDTNFLDGETEDYLVRVLEECKAPTEVNVDVLSPTSAEVSWTPGTASQDKWEVLYGVAPFDYDDAGGDSVMVEDDPNVTLTNLLPGTTYQVYVRAICDDGEGGENPGDPTEGEDPTTGDDPMTPCEEPYNADAPSDVYISSIDISGIGADLGDPTYDLIYTSNSMSATGYEVITNPVLTVYPGLEGTYTVSSGPAGNTNQYYYSVWFDFNQDGCFDEDEQIIWSDNDLWGGGIPNGEPGVEDVPMTWQIAGVAPGTYQARIRNSMIGYPGPEGNGDGEALDFTVEVMTEAEANMVLGVEDQVFTDFSYYPNPVENQLNLRAGKLIEQVEVFNLLGQKVIQEQPNALESNLTIDRLQSGVYLMNVTIDGSQKTFRIVKK